MTRKDLESVPATGDETRAMPVQEPIGVIQRGPVRVDSAGAPGAPAPRPAASAGAEADAAETDEDVEARLAYESLMRHRRARRRKKIVAAAIVAGLALAGGVAWGITSMQANQATEVTQLQTMPVFRGEFSESVQATGAAQPLSSVVVTPEVDGIIESVRVAEGSVVNEGDVLLTIKNDDLDRAVREAEISVRSAKAGVTSAQEAYDQTFRSYGQAAASREAASPQAATDEAASPQAASGEASLMDTSGMPPVTDTGATGGTDALPGASWADVQQAAAQLDSAKLALESAQQAYDQAVAQAGKRTVTAPSSGSVVVMNAVQGAALGAGGTSGSGGTLIQIADLSQMTVSVQVNEVDISRIAVGQTARVTFSALPGTMLDAQVTRISTVSSSDPNGYNYGVVTYDVELLIPNPAPELKPGMTASVEILLQHVPDAMTVPSSSLATDDGTSFYVYVMTDPETQACERRDVTVTAQSATNAAVEGNLQDGDLVVLDPYSVPVADTGAGEQDGGLAGGDAGAAGQDGGLFADDSAAVEDGAALSADAATAADAVADAEPAA